MKIAMALFATVFLIMWVVLLCMVGRNEWISAAFGKILDNMDEIDKLRLKDARNARRLEECSGLERRVMGLIYGGGSKKEIAKLEAQNEALQHGDMKGLPIFVIPGYVVQRIFPAIRNISMRRGILEKYIELYGKKYADRRTDALIAKLISYPLIGVPVAMALGVVAMALNNASTGAIVVGVGIMLVLVLSYALYDEVNDRLKKRRSAIARQFPNVVSKLALLVTSGMIMSKAWRETSRSRDEELYMEMRKTADELDNLMEPSEAYSNFIDRCNTKETTKLASAIIQNLTRGNEEIGSLLKNMAHEAWQERRNQAKRDSEAANSKLMIPTMLLFVAILVMIMVPVVVNFTGLM